MNFHISNLSPLRPQFSSSSLGAPSRSLPSPRLSHHEATNRDDITTTTTTSSSSSGPVRIAVEPAADELSSSNPGTDDGIDYDDDDDGDTDSLSDGSAENDVTQDSRDVLVQRLTDLAERIADAENVRMACIEALHKEVDEMERVLRGSNNAHHRDRSTSRHSHASSSRRRGRVDALQPGGLGSSSRPRSLQLPVTGGQSSSSSGGDAARGRESLGGGVTSPMSPSWLMSHFQRRPSVHQEEAERPTNQSEITTEDSKLGEHVSASSQRAPSSARVQEIQQPQRPTTLERIVSLDSSTSSSAPRISSQVAEDAIKEAEKLCAEMATVIESLQTRRQESDVMPSL